MRQWLVPPQFLCDRHLLGEHVEHHMFIGTIAKGVSVQGYLDGGLLEPDMLYSRHDILVAEMSRRGMKHKSPLPVIDIPDAIKHQGHVDPLHNFRDLANRCPDCRARIESDETLKAEISRAS